MEVKMKRILWITVIFFVVNIAVYAQTKSSAEIKQDSRQMLNEGQSSHSHFEEVQADLNTRNRSNSDQATYNRLRADLQRLENSINREQTNIGNSLDSGTRVSSNILERVQRLIDQYQSILAELENFTGQ